MLVFVFGFVVAFYVDLIWLLTYALLLIDMNTFGLIVLFILLGLLFTFCFGFCLCVNLFGGLLPVEFGFCC